MLVRGTVITALALSVPAFFGSLRADESAPNTVTVKKLKDKIRVEIGGRLFTEYVVGDNQKPILYPVIGPKGVRMTRDFPMTERKGEAKDHPHHRSLWFTHGAVNGISFWHEGKNTGQQVQKEVVKIVSGEKVGSLETKNDWVGPDGKVVCTDTRKLRFFEIPQGRVIDYEITVHASHGDILLGDTKEGTMGVRTHPSLRLSDNDRYDVKAKGRAVNSEGHKDRDLWGKRAKWVDYWAPIDGDVVGVAIFDHPSNLRHPTWWHARDYGLVAANPFGIHDFERKPDRTLGDVKIESGKSQAFRYRFVFHRGSAEEAGTAKLYAAYASE